MPKEPLSLQQLREYAVNRPDEYEITRQSLYDTQTYDGDAGQTVLTFFQDPIGASGKTKVSTNMESAGQLPAPKYFLIESIEILFFPGENPVSSLAVPTPPAAASFFANDVYTFSKNGYLDLFIGSKSYLTESPMGRFPGKTRLDVDFGFATGDTSNVQSGDYAALCGRPYFIDPQITLIPNQNFNITLNWPTAEALPSTNDATVKVILDGLLYRLSQ